MNPLVPTPMQVDVIGVTEQEIIDAWLVLLTNVLGIVVYLVFIFEFYRFVARRDVFALRLRRYARGPLGRGVEAVENALRVVLYLLEYVVVYPILIIIWFLAFAALFAFLAPELAVETTLLIAMSIVVGIRVTAYYSEDLSRDLAKMLPLALLGVTILEGASAMAFETGAATVLQIPLYWRQIMIYLLFLVPLELVLRITRIIVTGQISTVPTPPPGGTDSDADVDD